MSSDRNPPNKKRRRSSSESQINVQNMVTEEPKERPDKVWEDPVEKLRLEAIFLPKFENEKNDHQIRNEMIQLVRDDAGYIEVTLKHSGSLVLWSGGQRFYSKNSISNQFTAAAEILLRQHFERSWRNSSGDVVKDNATGQTGAAMYEDCSRYLQEARLTCSFEVVTAVLGDHGAMPMKDYLILTAVADRSTEQFYSTAKLLELAQRFRLPHNDSWAFTTQESTQALFMLYDTSRETGLAADTVEALSSAAEVHVPSMYPHTIFQGDILEGFVIRYIPRGDIPVHRHQEEMAELAMAANEILKQVPASSPASYEIHDAQSSILLGSNIRKEFEQLDGYKRGLEAANDFATSLERILSESDGNQRRQVNKINDKQLDIPDLTKALSERSDDKETQRISQLLQTLTKLNKSVQYSTVEEQLPAHPKRRLCTIHVLHDTTFFRFQRDKTPDGMNLFRGFCIELLGSGSEDGLNEQPRCQSAMKSEGMGMSNASTSLMLKMKFLPYMVRTFVCRNQLSILQQGGPRAFIRATRQLFVRWGISQQSKQRWIPFLEHWAVYAMTAMEQQPQAGDDKLPPLTSFSYLKHLEHFTRLYESGLAPSIPDMARNNFRGFVCVIAPTREVAEIVAKKLANALDCTDVRHIWNAVSELMDVGTVCYGSVDDHSGKAKGFLSKVSDYSSLVMYGCNDGELDATKIGMSDEKKKKFNGKLLAWGKQRCKVRLQLDASSASDNFVSEQFQEVCESIRETLEYAPPSDEEHSEGLLVFFPGIPGCGKSSLLKSLDTELENRLNSNGNGCTRKVITLMGDEYGNTFWKEVAWTRRRNKSCILIADKNTPPASWRTLGQICCTTSGFPLAVFPDESVFQTTRILGARFPDGKFNAEKSHFYPFSLSYLAVCLARVLKRAKSSHVGKLDCGTPTAAMVIIAFYSFYRYKSAEELHETLESQLRNEGALPSLPSVQLPFLKNANEHLPNEVEMVLTEALQLQLGYDNESKKISEKDGRVKEMEKRLRDCIAKYSDELLSMTVNLSTSREFFIDQMIQRISSIDEVNVITSPKSDIASSGESFIKLVSIDVPQSTVYEVIKQQEPCLVQPFLEKVLQDEEAKRLWQQGGSFESDQFVKKTHVTMEFWDRSTQEKLRQDYGPLVGSSVQVVAKALYWADNVAALEVDIAETSQDGKVVPRCGNAFPHITIWVGPDASARMSNDLPELLAQGQAQCIQLPFPVPVEGSFSFWTSGNA